MPPGIGVRAPGGSGLVSFDSYVRIDPVALAEMLRSAEGPAARALMLKADEVIRTAKELVGIDTRNLHDHIIKRMVYEGDSFAVLVGADVPYAIYHHEGSDAVEGKLMRFKPKGSSVFIFRTRRRAIPANRFLTDALARSNGPIIA